MAGYIFAVSQEKWTDCCNTNIKHGFFTPLTLAIGPDDMTSRKRKATNKVLAATFGDMVSMKPGDNIYFLSNRKIYGVGAAKEIGDDCKYDNYLDSSALLPDCKIDPQDYLTTNDTRARWVFFFEPSPYFFKKGVDMDDVLRYRPEAFKMLRAFEGLSFIKIDDEENRALREYISLVNEQAYSNINENTFSFDNDEHDRISKLNLSEYRMDINKSLSDSENREFVFSEMLIESALLQVLSDRSSNVMGHWDHLTHQIIASPFKPLKYIDKIDIFGYRFSENYTYRPKLITKYLLVEMKKGIVNRSALEQTMQYVDWICREYASGDYSMIEAYVVGDHAVNNIRAIVDDVCQRSFISETHPAKPMKWNDLKIVKYSEKNKISFEIVDI